MSTETPFELTPVPGFLRDSFTGKIAEATTSTPEEREANFLSRALAAFSIHKLSGCTLDAAAGAVVDGGNDGGIDAIYHAEATNILWVVQSKYHRNGHGEPDLGSVMKFKTGVEYLLRGDFTAFQANAAWQELIPRLPVIFGDSALQVRAVLVYSGINLVSEDRRRLFEDLQGRVSPDTDYLQTQVCNLTTIHDWITGADQGPGVAEVELKLLKPGWVKDPFETVYGLISLADLAALYVLYGEKLIAANIRAYKGDTTVNEQITATVREEAAHFFYLNNGLTAYCKRLEIHNFDRDNPEKKRIHAFGLSIVNGAQTLGSIAKCFTDPLNPVQEGFVFLKVISLERCEDDRGFAKRITRSTNFQNQIGARNFASLDEQRERIGTHLAIHGISYHYKDNVDTPAPDTTNFTLDEATTACASLANKADCDFCTHILADRQSLWSFEPIYPESDLYRSRYERIFRADMSARTVWRAVQTQRLVIDALKSSETGVRKDFFVNCRWLVLSLIFLRLRSQQGEALTLTVDESTKITTAVQDYAERLWKVCEGKGFVTAKTPGGWETSRNFRSVFCAAGDCRLLYTAVLADINSQSSV